MTVEGEILTERQTVNRLNKLNDETIKLKKEKHDLKLLQKAEFDELAIATICKQIIQENEELNRTVGGQMEEIEILTEENELLKEALREELQDNGNAYYIRIFDDLFDLEYDKWDMNEPNRECTDWEEILKEKGDVE